MIKTTCQECVFAVLTDNVQTGCKHDLLKKFSNKELVQVDDKQFYHVDGVCHLRRKEHDENIRSSSYVPCHFIILHDGPLRNLKATIRDINNVSCKKPFRIIVVLKMSTVTDPSEITNFIGLQSNIDYVVVNDEILLENGQVAEAVKSLKNGFVFIVNSGESVPSNVSDALNYYYIYVSETMVGTTNRCYMATLLKYLTEYGVLNSCKEWLVDWEEIDAAYRLSQNREST